MVCHATGKQFMPVAFLTHVFIRECSHHPKTKETLLIKTAQTDLRKKNRRRQITFALSGRVMHSLTSGFLHHIKFSVTAVFILASVRCDSQC